MEALMAGAGDGVNFKVKMTSYSSQGGRKHMEDMISVAYQRTADGKDLLYAYFGIFDGHGGKEAALYAKEHLRDSIVSQKEFWAQDDESVLRAIRTGFIRTHLAMWKNQGNWPRTSKGLPSTAGTTASIGFIRRGKLYTGHVGDSRIVSGYQGEKYWNAKVLTKDHKPDCTEENSRITESGGEVSNKSGVLRVVWNRTLNSDHQGPIRRSTPMTKISFLATTRSLGDFWSYNPELDRFIVSPVPDVSVEEIDVNSQRCFIFATDGLWDALSPQDAVNSVWCTENPHEAQDLYCPPGTNFEEANNLIDPAERLVMRALEIWEYYRKLADNISAVTVVINAAGEPQTHALCQNLKKSSLRRNTSVMQPTHSKSAPTTVSASGDQLQIVKNALGRREVKKALTRTPESTKDRRKQRNSRRELEPSISSDFSVPHSTESPCLTLAVITPNSTPATVENTHRGKHYESTQVVLGSGKRKRRQSPAKAVVEQDKPRGKRSRPPTRTSVESGRVDKVEPEMESGKGRRARPRALQLTKEMVRPRKSSATVGDLNKAKTDTTNVGKRISSSTKPSSDVTNLRRSTRSTRGRSKYYVANED